MVSSLVIHQSNGEIEVEIALNAGSLSGANTLIFTPTDDKRYL